MSEPTGLEQQQQAPIMREPAVGPLLPRWATVGFYVIFTPFCIFSVFSIVRSLRTQHTLTRAVAVFRGDLSTPGQPLDGQEGRQAMEVLKGHSVDSFLYLNQALLQNEDQDERMARALALRRAMDWGRTSARRQAIERILTHMRDDGSMAPDFAMDADMQRVLDELVKERQADPEMTYVEDLITKALAWVAEGRPTAPKGTEKKRLAALQYQYAKKVFQGTEASALASLAEEWQQESDPTAREAAAAFAKMLAGQTAALSPAADALCAARADEWEQRYRGGMTCVTQASREMVQEIVRSGVFLDHPHIYQYLSLLDHRFEEVRREVIAGAWDLRHNKFTIFFLSYFATKTAINPFLAVETPRLTREEHEREMRRSNEQRMTEAVQLLARIGVDYIERPEDYKDLAKSPDEYVGKYIVGALLEVADERAISNVVRQALQEIRAADLAQPAGPKFFKEAAGEGVG